MRLVPIQRAGATEELSHPLPAEMGGVLQATAELYKAAGFEPPWICYFAIIGDRCVGTCGFKSAPTQGRVEIAYFTFQGYEGRGVATQMARRLVSIARGAQPDILVTAQTLPDRNPSHRVLEKLGFTCVGALQHPEDGTVLEWHDVVR